MLTDLVKRFLSVHDLIGLINSRPFVKLKLCVGVQKKLITLDYDHSIQKVACVSVDNQPVLSTDHQSPRSTSATLFLSYK